MPSGKELGQISRRQFLKGLAAVAGGLTGATVMYNLGTRGGGEVRADAPPEESYKAFLPLVLNSGEPLLPPGEYIPNLEKDIVSSEKVPVWFKERMARPERIGVLEKEDYAVATTFIEIWRGEELYSQAITEEDRESVNCLENGVNQWFSSQLGERRLRYEGEVSRILVGESDIGDELKSSVEDLCIFLLEKAKEKEDLGLNQRLNIVFIKGIKGIALVAGNTVVMSLPENPNDSKSETQKAILAHLLGHACGLSHPQEDIDTVDTEFDIRNSFMHPSVLNRGLSGSIVLDSQLNPHKAKLMVTGFFPYEGKIYTPQKDGAIPLDENHLKELEDYLAAGEVKIAHGLYLHPCQNKEAFISLSSGVIDFGSAIIGQEEDYEFKEFGEHITRGIGLEIKGPTQEITIKGGTFIGFYRGVSANKIHKLNIEGVTVVDGRRIQNDARKPIDDEERGCWLYFWNTPEEDLGSSPDSYFSFGAGICLEGCSHSKIEKALVGHTTIGIADYKGIANTFEGNDLSECAMGLRFWQAKGDEEKPILVKGNVFHHNAQPCPWWWMHGDGAAILAAGIKNINIEENDFHFCGDGVFFCGFPQPPGRVEGVKIRKNNIRHCYAHGIELDFSQNCLIEENEIFGSWLSGIWAGHSSGILVYQNTFEENNRGRLFSGWTNSQGAISCPEGQITVVGNVFRGNWVAVNLWQDFVLPWFPFSGDASGHIVRGNTFRENKVGIRLANIRDSDIQTNLLKDNEADFIQVGPGEGIILENNGPLVDPKNFLPVTHFSHHRIFLTNLEPELEIPVYRVSPDRLEKINPESIRLEFDNSDDHWAIIEGDKIRISPTIGQDFAGFKAGRLVINEQDETRIIPLKLMAGNSTGFINLGEESNPEAGTSLGRVPFPEGRFGFSTPISDILKAEKSTNLTGSDYFSLRLTAENFSVSKQTGDVLFIVNSTDKVKVSLLPAAGSDEVLIYSGGPFESETWQAATTRIEPGVYRLTFNFLRCIKPEDSSDTEFFPLFNPLVVPLDSEEIRRLSLTSALGVINDKSLMSLPGTHRINLR